MKKNAPGSSKKFDISLYSKLMERVEADILTNRYMSNLIDTKKDLAMRGLKDMTLREYLQLDIDDPAKIQVNVIGYMQKRYKDDIKELNSAQLGQIARRILSEI